MSYLYTHIHTAEKILDNYKGAEPFHHHLKTFFKEYKKAGSKDRKNISHLCYTYFRIGRALIDKPFRERLTAALFLCEPQSVYLRELAEELPANLKQEIFHLISESGTELSTGHEWKMTAIKKIFPDFISEQIFPFNEILSDGLQRNIYEKSFLHQPDLHLRIRPGKSPAAEKLILLPGYLRHSGNSYAFKNGTNLEKEVRIDRDVIIQDWGSQQVERFFPDLSGKANIWDACAASGGKSILANDHYSNVELTVTDKRSSIIHNLVQRFSIAELRNYKSMVTDLSVLKPHKPAGYFDLVIADVPCSGSGTWGRNPENLYYFKEEKVAEYQLLQRSILKNLFDSVKHRGYLLYITCSVFRKENEENLNLITENGFDLVRSELINGISQNADSMFVALMRRKP